MKEQVLTKELAFLDNIEKNHGLMPSKNITFVRQKSRSLQGSDSLFIN